MPEPESTAGIKDAKLAQLRDLKREELEVEGYRDQMIREAREAGATPSEIDAALDESP